MPETPIIFFADDSNLSAPRETIRSGAREYNIEPGNFRELAWTINQLLSEVKEAVLVTA